MLTDAELQEYCRRLNLTAAAIQYIQRVRATGPSRKVRCGTNNVTARSPSRKMGRMVPAESHTVELAFIQQLEHDDSVIEFHAHPPARRQASGSCGGPSRPCRLRRARG